MGRELFRCYNPLLVNQYLKYTVRPPENEVSMFDVGSVRVSSLVCGTLDIMVVVSQ